MLIEKKNFFHGSCHCQKLTFELHTKKSPEEFIPRTDESTCSFCWKNDGTWIADPEGEFHIKKYETEKKHTPKNETASFCFCKNCGTLCYCLYESEEGGKAVIRARTMKKFQKKILKKR